MHGPCMDTLQGLTAGSRTNSAEVPTKFSLLGSPKRLPHGGVSMPGCNSAAAWQLTSQQMQHAPRATFVDFAALFCATYRRLEACHVTHAQVHPGQTQHPSATRLTLSTHDPWVLSCAQAHGATRQQGNTKQITVQASSSSSCVDHREQHDRGPHHTVMPTG